MQKLYCADKGISINSFKSITHCLQRSSRDGEGIAGKL
jgi:hypothetical protein